MMIFHMVAICGWQLIGIRLSREEVSFEMKACRLSLHRLMFHSGKSVWISYRIQCLFSPKSSLHVYHVGLG